MSMSESTQQRSLYNRLGGVHSIATVVDRFIDVAMSAEEAERQARGESTIAAREQASMDDLGLEIGAALAEAGDVEM